MGTTIFFEVLLGNSGHFLVLRHCWILLMYFDALLGTLKNFEELLGIFGCFLVLLGNLG